MDATGHFSRSAHSTQHTAPSKSRTGVLHCSSAAALLPARTLFFFFSQGKACLRTFAMRAAYHQALLDSNSSKLVHPRWHQCMTDYCIQPAWPRGCSRSESPLYDSRTKLSAPPKGFPLDRRLKTGTRHCLLTPGAPPSIFECIQRSTFPISNLNCNKGILRMMQKTSFRGEAILMLSRYQTMALRCQYGLG
jgi:hypothetical protein